MGKRSLLLIGPTAMIFVGINIFQNVPLTFLLFYSWLGIFPLIEFRKSYSPSIKRLTKKESLIGIGSGLLSLVIIFGSISLLFEMVFEVNEVKKILHIWGFSGSFMWMLVLFLIVLNPIFEELYWRDYMLGKLKFVLGNRRSVFITSFFYSLYHLLILIPIMNWPMNILAVFPVFVAGVLWAYFKLTFNSIFVSVVSHCIADMGIMLIYLIFLQQ